jgi:hypothetical protein
VAALHLPSIPEIEFFTVQIIALILLLIAGFKLIRHELTPPKPKRAKRRPKQLPRAPVAHLHRKGQLP